MRFLAVLIVALLAGCASANPAAREPETFDAANREPVCARECLGSYSICTGNAGATYNRLVASDILQACSANTRQCLSTCPQK